MGVIGITGLGQTGVIQDLPAQELPMTGLTDANNVRLQDNQIHRVLADTEAVVGEPTPVTPNWLLQHRRIDNAPGWLLCGANKIYGLEGTTYFNLTRQTAGVDVDYTGTILDRWNGGNLSGAVVLNNGIDVPQMWLPMERTQRLQPLTAWDANWRARTIRPFKNFLIALDVTKTASRFPTMVKWSHRADPGTVPDSWDILDDTRDAGENVLSETPGACVDCVPLRDTNIIYKEDSIWGMQEIGGAFIFRFYKIFGSVGMPVPHCAVEYESGKHFVFTGNDFIIHDGQTYQSLLSKRLRRALREILLGDIQAAFVVANPVREEVWFFYGIKADPAGVVTKAWIWNWRDNTFVPRILQPGTAAQVGFFSDEVQADASWDSITDAWGVLPRIWNPVFSNITELQFLHARSTPELRLLETREPQPILLNPPIEVSRYVVEGYVAEGYLATLVIGQADPANFTPEPAFVEKLSFGLPLRADRPPDVTTVKYITGIWLGANGTPGGQLEVTIGTQMAIDEPIEWKPPVFFTLGSAKKVDVRATGRLFSIRIRSVADIRWSLHSMDFNVKAVGMY